MLAWRNHINVAEKSQRFNQTPAVHYSTSMTYKKEKQILALGANICRKKPTTIDGVHWLMVELIAFANTYSNQVASKKEE
ncbi:MAG TPA: hypothetical protein VD794_00815 [Flavisolibacter sp.]|nr:hypothetical protein [Flavisolibacter sp.]